MNDHLQGRRKTGQASSLGPASGHQGLNPVQGDALTVPDGSREKLRPLTDTQSKS